MNGHVQVGLSNPNGVLLLLATTSEVTMDPTSEELQSLRVQAGSLIRVSTLVVILYATVQSQSRR